MQLVIIMKELNASELARHAAALVKRFDDDNIDVLVW